MERKNMETKTTMTIVFWDHKSIILVKFLECGTTISADRYAVTAEFLKSQPVRH